MKYPDIYYIVFVYEAITNTTANVPKYTQHKKHVFLSAYTTYGVLHSVTEYTTTNSHYYILKYINKNPVWRPKT